MWIDRARVIMLAFAFTLLSSCGGGGGRVTINPPAENTASLAVTVANLPAGVAAPVKVTGPSGFSQQITQTQTITGLAAGTYVVTASTAVSGSTTYVPAVAEQSIAVAAGASAAVTVSYSARTLTLGLRETATVPGAVFVTAPAGDDRLYVVERNGRIRIVEDGRMLTAAFLDISGRVTTEGEGGMLSMAFHPDYRTNGQFFVYYTDFERNIVVERFTVSSNLNVADGTSGLVIVSIPHPTYTNHFGGLVAFGTDGFLYMATDDGGGAGDPLGNARNLGSLLGKVLRIDVNGATIARRYTIPPSNPFVGQAGRRGEIWAYGLRNPWRFAFDSTGLYIADVGQGRREEVNIAPLALGGQNYGWNIMEGTLCFNASSCNQTGLTLPAFDYDHGQNRVNGCSITGGYVYRGTAIPELAGRYFYSDYCGGYLKSFLSGGSSVSEHTTWTIPDIGQVLSFGRDAAGELYMVGADGRIHKIVRNSTPTG